MNENPYKSPTTDSPERPARHVVRARRFSLGAFVVLVNFSAWHLGIFLDSFGGAIDRFGAFLCNSTWAIAWWLVPTAVLYCIIRRFLLSVRQWDLYGPALAVISLIIMYWELESSTRY